MALGSAGIGVALASLVRSGDVSGQCLLCLSIATKVQKREDGADWYGQVSGECR